MLIYFIYSVLEAIANGIYTTVATISSIEQALINLMMSTFLFVLGIACHPVMVIPMMLGGYYILRNFWNRRTKTPGLQSSMDGDAGLITAGARKEPRIPSYRSFAVGIDAPKDN
ncbi:uncharacterized protein LOC6735498 [Drosophila simulans]|uniref:GD25222 n=1 Tax=Drosophila simulans TaxID=7240 RepID=B4QFN0_DROSI|nr:uncharacterized protein LOC6735498 [Drosophila simulans]EDX08022.1 GD25222 [Drosophila simulans]KMY95451.1 uncharacterized protein Dsimw501_GD25222 [Drosophila simulans]